MSRTNKDRYRGKTKRRDGLPILDYCSYYPGAKKRVKKDCARRSRRATDLVSSEYNKRFSTWWDIV